MMSLTFGLFTQVSGSGPLGPLVKKHVIEHFEVKSRREKGACSSCFSIMALPGWFLCRPRQSCFDESTSELSKKPAGQYEY